MCALRGPTSAISRPASRTRLPPATPSTRTSSEWTLVRWPPSSTYLRVGRPWRMTPTFVLVPPTSKKTPSETRRCMSAPATLAAGPESIVRTGRRRISAASMTPPSPRMIMSGAVIPAARMLDSVMSAVSIIFGRMLALMTALRVRTVRP